MENLFFAGSERRNQKKVPEKTQEGVAYRINMSEKVYARRIKSMLHCRKIEFNRALEQKLQGVQVIIRTQKAT